MSEIVETESQKVKRLSKEALKRAKGLIPKDGYIFNPMRRYPRNLTCWCGSLKKSKHCCLPKLAGAVPMETGIKLEEYMKFVEDWVRKNEKRKNPN